MKRKIEFPDRYLDARVNGTVIKYKMNQGMWIFDADNVSVTLTTIRGVDSVDIDTFISLTFIVETGYSISKMIIYFYIIEIISMYYRNHDFHLERG